VTEVLGLRLAYRGFVTGLAAAYGWTAVAMLSAALLANDPLAPLRPLAGAIAPVVAGRSDLAFVLGLGVIQTGGGLIGMSFAYFFGRFFTVRSTLAIAAPAFALLAWALIAVGLTGLGMPESLVVSIAPVLGTVAYGLFLGQGLPLRGDVLRGNQGAEDSPSPST
jgi:hypothetical protein